MTARGADQKRDRALALYRAGLAGDEIARVVEMSEAWVWKWLRRANVERRPRHRRLRIGPEEMKVVLRLRADGATYAEIGRELGMPLATVYKTLRRSASPVETYRPFRARGRFTAEHVAAILDALRAGETYARIAARHSATKQAIGLIALKNGLGRYRRTK